MYYLVSLLSSPLTPLTYMYEIELKVGNIVDVTLNGKQKFGVILEKIQEPEFKCNEILNIKEEFFTSQTISLAKFISEYYVCSLGDALNLFTPSFKNTLHVKHNIVTDMVLSKEQQKAYEFISHHDKSLLFGDTGSGKTEVYIKTIQECINSGKNAILLLPEIGLTPQIKNRMKKVFGSLVAIWHSKVTKKKKQEILASLNKGEISLIVGTRSALFLPVEELGLIIVDEEHDDSYKSNQRPRYNAKDLALLFGKRKEAKVLLGSATPSLNSYKNLPTFRLKGTYFSSQKKFIYEASEAKLSESLLSKIKEHLDKNSQIIIFLPIRANFKLVVCKDCGKSVSCPYCSVSMSLHVNKNALVCHYCNFSQRIPQICPSCSSSMMQSSKMGTAEVHARLSEIFKNKVIQKFDTDEIKTANNLNQTLKDFNDKKIDILVGTQMLSKGHDYHSVSLSVIMGIDSLLHMPDFRARERAMSLLLQVSGRSGRVGAGEVFIQSLNEDFFKEFIYDYETFIKDELTFRQDIYPPYIKLLKVLISHKNDEKAKDILAKIVQISKNFPLLEVVGHGKSNIEKIANKYRYNMLVRSNNIQELLKFAHTCKDYPVEIDIDPLSFS